MLLNFIKKLRPTQVQHEVKDEQRPEERILLENAGQSSLLFLELSCQIQKREGFICFLKYIFISF